MNAARFEYVVDFNDATALAGLARYNAAFKAAAQQQTASHEAMGTAAKKSSDTVTDAMNKATRAVEDHGKKTKSVLEMIEWRLKYTAISAATYAGTAGIGAFTAALVAASSAGIQFNSMMEKSAIAYTTMLGSAGEASNMLGKLYDLAAKSPFTFEDFVTGTQRLIAYGVAAKDVLRTLNAIGDATAAVGGTTDVFTRMSFSIGQMVSQGKITAREMRELAMAGVPAWQVLAEAIGKTVAETQKLSETTGIAAEVGIPALLEGIEKRFGGMQEKMNQTWTALVSTFKDYMSQMAGYAEGGFFETLKKQLNDINNWIGEINDRARQVGFMNALKEQSPEAYEALRLIQANLEVVKDLGEALYEVYQAFFGWWTPEMRTAATVFAEFAIGASIISKVIPMFTRLRAAVMGMSVVKSATTMWTAYSAAARGAATMGGTVAVAQARAAVMTSVLADAQAKALVASQALTLARAREIALLVSKTATTAAVTAAVREATAAELQAAAATRALSLAQQQAALTTAELTAAQAANAASAGGVRAGLANAGKAAWSMTGALGKLGIALAVGGTAYMLYKRHLEEVAAAQQAVIDGAKALTISVGATWIDDIGESATTSAAKVASFFEQNKVAIEALREMNDEQKRLMLSSYAVQMEIRGVDRSDIQEAIDKLAQEAELSVKVPVGVDPESALDNFRESFSAALPQMRDELQELIDRLSRGGFSVFPDMSYFKGEMQLAAKTMAAAMADAASSGNWIELVELFDEMSAAPQVMQVMVAEFGKLTGVAGLASGSFDTLRDVMTVIAHDDSLPEAVRTMAKVWLDTRGNLDAAARAYEGATVAIKRNNAALQVQEELIEAATEAWQKELEAQYSIGDAINEAIRRKQEELNAAASVENDRRQKAAEAERKAIDARANAEIKSIERVRDIRLASLKEQEELYKEQKSLAEKMGGDVAGQLFDKQIRALEEEQQKVKDAADAEKDAIKARAEAQKEGVEAVKVSAEQAKLSIDEITKALEEAMQKSDDYLTNMALLGEKQSLILDSGLTPEQKQQLAEELVAGSEADRERAFRILQEMADRRSKEAAEQLGRYSATVSAAAGKATQEIVDAMVGTLKNGGIAVYGAVNAYAGEVAKALNPILEALGARQITIATQSGRIPGSQLLPFAMGGFLPNQATIQRPVGPRGLVQWAEPSTKGEAFIPLAPEKRERSIPIWIQTGRMLGMFASGGILSPWEGMERPDRAPNGLIPPTLLPVFGNKDISIPHSGNVGMQGAYDLASAWMKSPGAAGAASSGAAGFAGMVATAVAIWEAVKNYDAAIRFMGGRAYRPYKSDHTTGHAFDFGGSTSQMAAAAAWLAMMNPNEDVKYIIHNPLGIWKPSTGWRPYTPSQSVLKFAGESAWHRDHVHVSTYDQGGLLMPGLTLAYNGTNRPERVLADGGFANFIGGTDPVTYTASQTETGRKLTEEWRRAEAAARVYAAALQALEAQGASTEQQLSALHNQLEALGAEREAVQEFRDLAAAAGATDEQLADFDINLAGLDVQMAELAKRAEELARVPLAEALSMWNRVLSQTQMLMDLLSHSSDAFALKMSLFPTLMGQMAGSYQAALDLMRASTTNADIMEYASQALSALGDMFSAEQAMLQDALDRATSDIEDAQSHWEKAWQERSDAVEQSYDDQIATIESRNRLLDEKYDAEIERIQETKNALQDLWAEQDRAAELASLERDRKNILAQGYYTKADVQRLWDLADQIERKRLENARANQLDALEARVETLEKQKQAAEAELELQRQQLEEQHRLQLQALEEERALKEQEFTAALEATKKAYQAEIDALVAKYADMANVVMAEEQALLAEKDDYFNAGQTLGLAFAEGMRSAVASVTAAAKAIKEAAAAGTQLAPGLVAVAQSAVQPVKYDNGGVLRPGLTLAYNATGTNEYVFRGDQIRVSRGGHDVLEVRLTTDDAGVTDAHLDALADELERRIDQRMDNVEVSWGRR